VPPDPHLPTVERRRSARRATDLPPDHHNWLITLIVRNPVTVGMTMALLLATVALILVLVGQGSVRVQQRQLTDLNRRQTVERQQTVFEFCKAINANALVGNRQTDFLRQIILSSVKQSRAFDKTYRKFGLPPYRERLHQAEQLAAGLSDRKLPILDCEEYARRVASERPK
jgi:hypothetical protein